MNYLALYEPVKETSYKLLNPISQYASQNNDLNIHPLAYIGVGIALIGSLYAIYLLRKTSKKISGS